MGREGRPGPGTGGLVEAVGSVRVGEHRGGGGEQRACSPAARALDSAAWAQGMARSPARAPSCAGHGVGDPWGAMPLGSWADDTQVLAGQTPAGGVSSPPSHHPTLWGPLLRFLLGIEMWSRCFG